MKLEEVKKTRKIEAFYRRGEMPMSNAEIVDAFKYVVAEIQSEIADCSCRYSMNQNLEECKIIVERIAALVSDYSFKTEFGIS